MWVTQHQKPVAARMQYGAEEHLGFLIVGSRWLGRSPDQQLWAKEPAECRRYRVPPARCLVRARIQY